MVLYRNISVKPLNMHRTQTMNNYMIILIKRDQLIWQQHLHIHCDICIHHTFIMTYACCQTHILAYNNKSWNISSEECIHAHMRKHMQNNTYWNMYTQIPVYYPWKLSIGSNNTTPLTWWRKKIRILTENRKGGQSPLAAWSPWNAAMLPMFNKLMAAMLPVFNQLMAPMLPICWVALPVFFCGILQLINWAVLPP